MTVRDGAGLMGDRRVLRSATAWRGGGILALLVAAVVFPFVFNNPLVTTIGVDTMIFVGAASAWNIPGEKRRSSLPLYSRSFANPSGNAMRSGRHPSGAVSV